MSEPKTRPTGADVHAFLEAVEPPRRREDALALLALMEAVTGAPGEMWGPSIVGFGTADVTYADGSTRPWMRLGFSPRKTSLVLYLMGGMERAAEALERLGKHKLGKGCLYVKKLADVDEDVLREVVGVAWGKG